MADPSHPVLIYDRIDVNRRNTRVLLTAFALILLPLAYGLAQFFARVLRAALVHRRSWLVPSAHDITGTEIVAWTIVLLAYISGVGFVYFGSELISAFLVSRTGARRARRDEEPDLFRTVESLCIGAGLPPPTLYIVESTEPNAFTTGCDPEHASLVISRGLIHVLNERELAAVVAHELSHIGNHDSDFSVMLAALVGTLSLPLRVVKEIVSFDDLEPIDLIVLAALVFLLTVDSMSRIASQEGWSLLMFVASPIYLFIVAPGCAMLLRRTISQQRDFLADADAALLTRDPEGLALALAKVGGAIHFTATADPATAHLYFVDPLPRAHLGDGPYPSHPPIDERIALLARMGDGIPEAKLGAAAEAGVEYRHNPPLLTVETARAMAPRIDADEAAVGEPGSHARLTDPRTPLYKAADPYSAVLAELDSNAVVTIENNVVVPIEHGNLDAQFMRVRLVNGTVGYIPLSTGLAPSDDHREADQIAGVEQLSPK